MLALLADMEGFGVDWIFEEIPGVFAAIGPAAIPDLARFLADGQIGTWPRCLSVTCLEGIVRRHPDTREECTDIVIGQLEQFEGQDKLLNASLIGALIEWKAVQAAPLMEKAFDADAVDIMAVGDWEDVQVEMGLLEDASPLAPTCLPAPPGSLLFSVVAQSRRPRPRRSASARNAPAASIVGGSEAAQFLPVEEVHSTLLIAAGLQLTQHLFLFPQHFHQEAPDAVAITVKVGELLFGDVADRAQHLAADFFLILEDTQRPEFETPALELV